MSAKIFSNLGTNDMDENIKQCSVCKRTLPVEQFYKHSRHKDGLTSECKECIKQKQKQYREDNTENIRAKKKKWQEENRTLMNQWSKDYVKRHPDRRKESLKRYYETHKENKQEYAKKHMDVHNKSCKKYNEKSRCDPVLKMKFRMRSLLYVAFKNSNTVKSKHTEEIIGLPATEFCNYLLETFKNIYGRDWDGKEEVNIDHIIPVSTAETEEDVIRLNHYSNLRLITKEDNLKKGTKINYQIGGNIHDQKTC